MKIVVPAAALALGVCVGIAGSLTWIAFGPAIQTSGSVAAASGDDHRDYGTSKGLTTAQLARALLGRAALGFVADTRAEQPGPSGGVGFYTLPKPYGDTLCRVDLVQVPAKVVRGHIEQRQEFWDDDVSVQRLYGIWRMPGAATSQTGEGACPRFRDFGHLIRNDDGIALERTLNAIGLAVVEAKTGRINFNLTCADYRKDSRGAACDGVAILRQLDVRNIAEVEPAPAPGPSDHLVDRISMEPGGGPGCGKSDDMSLDVTSSFVDGKDLSTRTIPTDIHIAISTFC